MLLRLANLLFSPDPRLRNMLLYWAGSALFYSVSIVVLHLQAHAGYIEQAGAGWLSWFMVAGLMLFALLIRLSVVLKIAPRHLAFLQALFGFACNMGGYMLMGEVRGATLVVMLVIMVFCTFSLRPRATRGLCVAGIVALGLTMSWMVANDPERYPLHIEVMHFLLGTSALLAVTLLTGEMSKLRSSLKQQKQELLTAVSKIRTLATIDELTCLANRRYMNEVLTAEERRRPDPDQPMCIALLDIDFFKSVNDKFGHDGGDSVLRTFAAAARSELRAADLLARWGGEEFLLMLPATEVNEAMLVLKRMAERVRAIDVPGLDMQRDVTFSAGLVKRIGSEPFAETITRADKAMYEAKSSGRDRVVAA